MKLLFFAAAQRENNRTTLLFRPVSICLGTWNCRVYGSNVRWNEKKNNTHTHTHTKTFDSSGGCRVWVWVRDVVYSSRKAHWATAAATKKIVASSLPSVELKIAGRNKRIDHTFTDGHHSVDGDISTADGVQMERERERESSHRIAFFFVSADVMYFSSENAPHNWAWPRCRHTSPTDSFINGALTCRSQVCACVCRCLCDEGHQPRLPIPNCLFFLIHRRSFFFFTSAAAAVTSNASSFLFFWQYDFLRDTVIGTICMR